MAHSVMHAGLHLGFSSRGTNKCLGILGGKALTMCMQGHSLTGSLGGKSSPGGGGGEAKALCPPKCSPVVMFVFGSIPQKINWLIKKIV